MILVTGGAGYIGSHACVALLSAGEAVVVFDNFCNSSPHALERVQKICGKLLVVVKGDVRDQDALEKVLVQYRCTAVMHFAGLKSVKDSVAEPLEYYDQNVVWITPADPGDAENRGQANHFLLIGHRIRRAKVPAIY